MEEMLTQMLNQFLEKWKRTPKEYREIRYKQFLVIREKLIKCNYTISTTHF